MKKNRILLSVLPVLVLLFALSLTSFAADSYSVEENTVYVSTYAELKAELEDLNATADSNKLVVTIPSTDSIVPFAKTISLFVALLIIITSFFLSGSTDEH